MKEGLRLTKMNVGSLYLSLIRSLARPLEYRDGDTSEICLSLGEGNK